MNTQAVGAAGAAGASVQAALSNDAAQASVGAQSNAQAVAQKAAESSKPVAKPTELVTNNDNRDPRSLQYQVDSSSRQIVATIVDDSNKTVIVQIPDAEMLRIAKAIDRMQGFLVDHKA